MASNFHMPSFHFCNPKTVLSDDRFNIRIALPYSTKINMKEQDRHIIAKKVLLGALSSTSSSFVDSGESILEQKCSLSHKISISDIEFNKVNCLVWMLHESARSFSVSIQNLGLARTGAPLAMAWIGVDVHAWHKHIAYQVAIYALLIAVTEVELILSNDRPNGPSSVLNILSLRTNFLGDLIESQLNTRNPKLVQWFRLVELPRVAGSFMLLFKKWTLEYAGSGVAGNIMAIASCAAVEKLSSERISCYLFSNSIEDALVELMNATNGVVSLDKLHHLSTGAGFEEDFLSHFGSKIVPNKNVEDVEFWYGLVQRKLSTAFHRENVTNRRGILTNKIQENSLATLALFAYLGRETRFFLSRHGIKDLDEQTKDFLSYLECSIIFLHPEFSTLSEYQLLMEVILDEIGWVDFYAAYDSQLCQERRRSKAILAEKEITLRAVFTVCYDVILGFAHCHNSQWQALDANLLDFLLQSQARLSTCLEDYWDAYDGTIDLQKIGEKNDFDFGPNLLIKGTKSSLTVETMQKCSEGPRRDQATSSSGNRAETYVELAQQSFFRKSTDNLVAATLDVWMGTQLLFVDVRETLRLLKKKLHGYKVTKRESRKMQRTGSDIATLIPIAILMLLPVSAVGHAAMFAAIKKYMPSLIPSPYSDERIDLVKQLKRIKKMQVQLISIEESTSKDV